MCPRQSMYAKAMLRQCWGNVNQMPSINKLATCKYDKKRQYFCRSYLTQMPTVALLERWPSAHLCTKSASLCAQVSPCLPVQLIAYVPRGGVKKKDPELAWNQSILSDLSCSLKKRILSNPSCWARSVNLNWFFGGKHWCWTTIFNSVSSTSTILHGFNIVRYAY